jgi:hypothetical protein
MLRDEAPTREARWPVARIEPGHDLGVVLLGADWLRLDTHFYKRTQICLGSEACPVCAFLPARSYYYLPAVVAATRRPTLLELSPLASSDLEQQAKLLEQGLRPGLELIFTRRSCRAPVRCSVVRQGAAPKAVPHHVWVSAVMAVFGFGAMLENEDLVAYRKRLMPSAVARCERLAGELKEVSPRSSDRRRTR